MKKKLRQENGVENVIYTTLSTIFLICLAIVTLYPILNTLAVSFNDATDTIRGGIYLWPRIWTFHNYETIWATQKLGNAFVVSVARTVIGAGLDVALTAMVAYTLTRKDFVLGKFVTLLYVLTMYVNAGLIPGYMVNKTFGLVNNFLVYIIPGLVSAFNLIVVRTYMKTIPDSLHESAEIDGAGEFTIFLKIILPLSMPVLATVTLFSAVGQWNQWFDTMIYCSGSPKLHTLQYKLMAALQSSMNQSGTSTANVVNTEAAANQVTPVSIRAATTIVAAVPILIVYPFLQKYFVTGMTVGSVKE
jgi:putative aldouronate transport system permease protein